MLKVDNLSCQRSNDLVFKNLSFEVSKGANTEIIGSNGSGKTSLLKCILGLIEKNQGKISWKQKPIEETRTFFLKSCFYQGHQLALKNNFTVVEKYRERASSDLSMGQLKRLAIAKWLLDEHELYLIDEPFASLDQEGTLLVSSIIKNLNSKGCSFLFTSHTSSNIDSREILLDNYS